MKVKILRSATDDLVEGYRSRTALLRLQLRIGAGLDAPQYVEEFSGLCEAHVSTWRDGP